MKQHLLSAAVAALVASVVVFIGSGLVGNQSVPTTDFGASGFNRFPNSGVVAKFLNITATPGTVTSAGTDGSITASGGITVSAGDVRLSGNVVQSDKDGTIVSINSTATTTLTSAHVCDNTYINVSFSNTSGIATFPDAADLISDCLTTVGDTLSFKVRDSSATSTNKVAFAAGASSTISRPQTTSTIQGDNLATTTITSLGIANIEATLITSSTPWVVWQIESFQ